MIKNKKKLNECYEGEKSISENLREYLFSLTRYMLEKGLSLSPLPKVVMVDDDDENASMILGRTAAYRPDDLSIIIYTKNRHPKDILRSFAHEMIHHKQHLENRLPNVILTQDVNEDDELAQLEEEAYREGNMAMRSWENSLKLN